MGSEGPTRRLSAYYPAFRSGGPFLDANESWLGPIRPFAACGQTDLPLLVDDLAHGARVLLKHGRLLHDPACRRRHGPIPYAEQLADVEAERFAVRLIVWPPPQHPKVVALYPEISARACPGHPHLFRGDADRGMPDALCTYRPGDGEWSWQTGDLVLALDYAALFLAKHVIWCRTGGGNRGRWIGPQASHEPEDLVRELAADGECRCGKGLAYRACCLPLDRWRVNAMQRYKNFVGAHRPT
jgi:hypothetical protein